MSREPRVLHLTLKRRWFDMIASGEKKEEYREIKPYWIRRLVDEMKPEKRETDFTFPVYGTLWSMLHPIGYDIVEFKNGYRKDAPKMRVEILDITDGFSEPKWADEYKACFIIKLGKILSISNYKISMGNSKTALSTDLSSRPVKEEGKV